MELYILSLTSVNLKLLTKIKSINNFFKMSLLSVLHVLG